MIAEVQGPSRRPERRDGRCPADPGRGPVRLLGHWDHALRPVDAGYSRGSADRQGIDTSAFGLDAAAPAIFLALVWPQLCRDRGRAVAAGAAVVTLGLVQPSRPRPRHDHRACPERHPASASRSPEGWCPDRSTCAHAQEETSNAHTRAGARRHAEQPSYHARSAISGPSKAII